MNPSPDVRALSFDGPRGWVQRVLFVLLGGALLLVAFFFLTIAIVAGGLIALAVGLRWWWVMRKLRAQARASDALEGEYRVVERTDLDRRLER